MFALDVFDRVLAEPQFKADYAKVREGLALNRLGQPGLFDDGLSARLMYFVECVLASAPTWNERERSSTVCRVAAEVAELLSAKGAHHSTAAKHLRMRAALLYELADFPALASAV